MKILLVEPGYKNKYPPLGLMKISAYHKCLGDEVVFVKGEDESLRKMRWDRIYITTLFTFYWNRTIKCIQYYINSVEQRKNIYVGGVLATLLYEDLLNETTLQGITILKGLLNQPGILGNDKIIIDTITPDYDIVSIEKNPYLKKEYKITNAYITSTTKGCIRKCRFCAVKILEPEYCSYIDIKEQIRNINEIYGEKRHLMLMDNNILASNKLKEIVEDLIQLGFGRGNKSYIGFRNRKLTRYIDFNQGIDARLITENTMKLLSKLEIRPLRIAFDHADEENAKIYIRAQRLAAQFKFPILSNYILFNFEDSPYELYYRLKINIELNEEFKSKKLKTKIWSFPMKYMPLTGEHCKDRKYVGKYWNKKLLRGIQCVLNATHGVVGPKKNFFEHAFGKEYNEFLRILYMPEDYIIQRKVNTENGNINKYNLYYNSLNKSEMDEFIILIKDNVFNTDVLKNIKNLKIKRIYNLYSMKDNF
ncbi:cobalamin-binding domain-containing protein [Thomasclavelia sp.]|uniref:cobalamin-binding domain-containing protein n=1 Tax=Thomasclavelia sp. TaxID=3025757 RepID=UPI0025D95FB8|nr:cobalamin-binding domain-containing protein [Thomasclavelia sp.]